MTAAYGNKIGNSFLKQPFAINGMLHKADGNNRNLNALPDSLSQRLFKALAVKIGLNVRIARLLGAAAYINGINAFILQILGYFDTVADFEAALYKLIGADTDTNREVMAAGATNARNDLGNEAHTVLKITTILVSALIGI